MPLTNPNSNYTTILQYIKFYALSSRYQGVFALLLPSCCDKSGTSCYHFVTRPIMVTDVSQTIPTIPKPAVRTSCYEHIVINLLRADVGLLASSTLLQDDNWFYRQQLGEKCPWMRFILTWMRCWSRNVLYVTNVHRFKGFWGFLPKHQ